MPQDFFGGERQRVILADRDSLVRDKRQAIDIGVNRHADVAVGILYELLQLSKVFGDRLGRSWEAAVGLHVNRSELATEQLEQDRHERTARAANAVEADSESLFPDAGHVQKRQGENPFDVLPGRVLVVGHGAELVPRRAWDISVDDLSHLCPLRAIEEQSGWRDELEGIPLDRVVAGGYRETAIGLMMLDSELYRWRRDHSDVDHVTPNRLQRSVHDGLEHWSRNPAVATHHDACFSTGARESPGAEASCEFRDDFGC